MNPYDEIRSSIRLVREIAELCEHAGLTGSLEGGAPRVALRYNATLARLVALGAVPPDLFGELPPDSGYGEIGAEARMLASYAKKGEREDREGGGSEGDPGILLRLAPFVRREDLADMVRDQMRVGQRFDLDLVSKLGPFLPPNVIGDLVRAAMGGARPAPPEPPSPPASPEPPAPPTAHDPTFVFEPPFASEPSRDESLEEMLTRLKGVHLSSEEKRELLEKLRDWNP
jgi:hypothetical protein